jgi:Plasmid pRiA4b ORF-3-like protein
MPIFKFRVAWQEDDNIQRDIEILSSHTFQDFHYIIKAAFLLKPEWHATFGVLNEVGKRTYTLDTKVEKNIKGAERLSTQKTPIGALVLHPSQEFVYGLENDKEWDFLISLITVYKEDANDTSKYPGVVRIEGLSPMELGAKKGGKKEKDKIVDVEEKYDLESTEGFGNEGDEDEGGSGFTIEGGEESGQPSFDDGEY